MTDIVPTIKTDIRAELENLQLYKNHPNGLINVSLNRIKDMLGGKVELVDPSNPFLYLLETSCLNTTFALQESAIIHKQMYPRLANNEEELYRHMSDEDYLDRFSVPATHYVTFQLQFNEFRTKAYVDPITKDKILTIPRYLRVKVDDYIFSITAPIIIRLTESGVLDIRYDVAKADPTFNLDTNIIDFQTYRTNQDEVEVTFKVLAHEVDISATEIPVEKSKLFKSFIAISDSRYFYSARAFYSRDGRWHEMLTTHTDQVYDISTPTCIFKVNQTENKLEYYIPPVYVNSGRLGTKVKFVVYTTKGPINVNFSDYKFEDFNHVYEGVFREEELNDTTKTLNLIPKLVYLEDRVMAGHGPKSFQELKEDVIENSLGVNRDPITDPQLKRYLEEEGFRVIRHVDVVTDRIFLLESNIPDPVNRATIPKPDLGIIEYMTHIPDLRTGKNQVFGLGDDITIIPEGTLFEYLTEGLRILTEAEANELTSKSGSNLVKELNRRRILSTYYHYILDTGDEETNLRPYDISNPEVKLISHKDYNSTTRIGINSLAMNVTKVDDGFVFDVSTSLKIYDEMYNEDNITAYMIASDGDGVTFFLKGIRYAVLNDSPVYRFHVKSDFYIDSRHKLHVNNFMDEGGSIASFNMDLNTKFNLLYVTDKVPGYFEATEMDRFVRGSFIGATRAAVSMEEITVSFGDYLEYLYSRVHNSVGVQDYKVYEEDVVAVYEKTVYGADNTPIHYKNEVVLDEDGEPIVRFRKGDLVLDEDGEPVLHNVNELARYINLAFIDYRYLIGSSNLIREYMGYVKSYLRRQVTDIVKRIQGPFLDNTVGYMTVPTNLNNVIVQYNGISKAIKSGQEFVVSVYLDRNIYEDMETRNSLEEAITDELIEYLSKNRKLSRTKAATAIMERVGEFVRTISIVRFTEVNAEYIEILNESDIIGVDKELTYGPEGYRVKNSVKVNFMLPSGM